MFNTKDELEVTEKDENDIGKSFFPIEIQYENGKGKIVINSPNDLISGKSFRIYRTRIKNNASN